jgi:uncharacterized protein YeeX (DUF496 family)
MSDEATKLKEAMLVTVVKDTNEIKIGIAEIKVDLREHMRRTLILEAQSEFMKKNMYAVYGVIAFLSFVAATIKILEVIKH